MRAEAEALSAGRHRITLDAERRIRSARRGVGDCERLRQPGEQRRPLHAGRRRGAPDAGARSARGAEFAVEDTGVGIEPEHIPRLTERFYRVDRGRSRETGGTGLGLAIVKHALARHQATLEIESTLGKGTRFTANFPARRVVPAASRAASGVVT